MSRYDLPKTSGGAMSDLVVSIIVMVLCIVIPLFYYIGSWVKHWDWVEVTATEDVVDCKGYYCTGRKSDHEMCSRCTIIYKYEYNGPHTFMRLHTKQSETGQITVRINPDYPGPPFEEPHFWIVLVGLGLGGLMLPLVFLSWKLYNTFKRKEEDERQIEMQKVKEFRGDMKRE